MTLKFTKLLICILVVIFTADVPSIYAQSELELTVSSVCGEQGENIEVPIVLSGNTTGIAGMSISISYDSKLTLDSITRGSALSTLNYIPSGDLSANPCNVVFYGLDADISNGVVIVLKFEVSKNAVGKHSINISYTQGNIFDGELNDLDMSITNGSINVVPETNINSIEIKDYSKSGNIVEFDVDISTSESITGNILVAIYDKEKTLMKSYVEPAKNIVNISVESYDGKYLKVMWWGDLLKPFAESVVIEL